MAFSMWVFIVFFISMEVGAEADDTETITLAEGSDLSLHPGVAELKGYEQILWTFESGSLSTRVAQIYEGNIHMHYKEEITKLDRHTGILTISDIKMKESGLYKVLIVINTQMSTKQFNVDVYAPVSEPGISGSLLNSGYSSPDKFQQPQVTKICFVFCSVKNGRGVSISWYKGDELVNQTSNLDLTMNLSLPLELHYNDPETYSCMAANPVSNKTIHLHMKEICPQQEDCVDHCGITEALIRLVLSGLVGIATVVFLVEHVWFCSSQGRAASSA